MTLEKDELKVIQKYVLFFDICSSTSIIDDLIRLERQHLWLDLLINMKEYLQEERSKYGYEIYKFVGDGWILLFDKDIQGKDIFEFLKNLCSKFDDIYSKTIKGILSVNIDVVGITFGLDEGSLTEIVMNSQKEYVGRALNLAARLQGAIKDNDDAPQGKVLMANKVYSDLKQGIRKTYKILKVERNLRNVSEGKKIHAKKLCLFIKP